MRLGAPPSCRYHNDDVRRRQTRDSEGSLATLTDRGAIVVLEAPLPVFRSPSVPLRHWFDRVDPIRAGARPSHER